MPAPTNFLAGVLGSSASSANTVFEPQRANNGMLLINGLAGILGADAPVALSLSLASFTLPKEQTNQLMIPYLNEQRKFAGRTMFEDISASFYDYLDRQTVSLIRRWRQRVYNPQTGKHGLKSQYACSGTITMFAPNGEESGGIQNVEYTVEGIWPSSVDPGNIDFGSDDMIRIGMLLSIDKCYVAAVQDAVNQ